MQIEQFDTGLKIKKNIEDVDYNDLNDYWRFLDERGANLNEPKDMAGQKKQIKTLLNKLIKTARITDKEKYGNLPDLVYPIIHKTLGTEEVEVLQRDEWNLLLEPNAMVLNLVQRHVNLGMNLLKG